jgi:hypothetical protein
MGACIYCGASAGFLRKQHRDCRTRHDLAAEKIPTFFVKCLESRLPAARFKELVTDAARNNHIGNSELQSLVLEGISNLIDTVLADHAITASEEARIDELCKAFSVGGKDLIPSGAMHKLAKGIILRELENGRLPDSLPKIEGDLPLNLERDEVIIWVFNGVSYLTPRTRTKYVGGSHGMSFRIMKGVYYRVGAFKGEPVKTEYLSNEGHGDLVITNRNVYFVSPQKVLKLPPRKILSIQPYADGIAITRDAANAKPQIFILDDPWFATNAIARLNQISD